MSAALWVGLSGIAFTLIGAVLSGLGLVQDAIANGHWLARAPQSVRSWIRWYLKPGHWGKSRLVLLPGVEVKVGVGVTAGPGVLKDAPNDRLEEMQLEIAALRAGLDGLARRQAGTVHDVIGLRRKRHADVSSLRDNIKSVAVGTLSLQLLSLTLVGIGSLLSAFALVLTEVR